MGIKLIFESKLYIVEKINPLGPMMREVSLETLPNVNIRDPSHNKNLPIMSNWVDKPKCIQMNYISFNPIQPVID